MNIKELRTQSNMSQSEFAKRFNIPIKTLQHWEQGDSAPANYLLALIAKEIPQTDTSLIIIRGKNSLFYFNENENSVCDENGTKILLQNDISMAKPENLGIWLEFLFENYYQAQKQFVSECESDKDDDIIWERFD